MKLLLRLGGLAVFLAAHSVFAVASYVAQVPHGNVHRCATCHEKSGPPDLNAFGYDFLGAGGKWTAELAREDSDKDGASNGQELGDVAGRWRPGAPLPLLSARVSLPGDAASRPVPLSRWAALAAPFTTLLGHFHPLLVHLPIGGLLLVGLLELLALLPHLAEAAQGRSLLLGLTLAGALLAAGCGWVLAESGNYEAELLRWHKWTGVLVAAACLVTWGLSRRARREAYQPALWGTIALLMVASHFGGSLTHGSDFLSLQLPGAPAITAQARSLANDSTNALSVK